MTCATKDKTLQIIIFLFLFFYTFFAVNGDAVVCASPIRAPPATAARHLLQQANEERL